VSALGIACTYLCEYMDAAIVAALVLLALIGCYVVIERIYR
jgi:hypothetical protein